VACLALYFVGDHRLLQFTFHDICSVDDFGGKWSMPLAGRIFEETTFAIKSSLLRVHLLAQVWFNHRSGAFTGSFKISAIGSALVLFAMAIVVGTEAFSSHSDKNTAAPFGVETVLDLVPLAWSCYQAITYRGVPQVEPVEDEDE